MKRYITSYKLNCEYCGKDLEIGDEVYVGTGDEVLCEDCSEKLANDLFGETYG